jgi:hypothetical protein
VTVRLGIRSSLLGRFALTEYQIVGKLLGCRITKSTVRTWRVLTLSSAL